MLGTDYEILTDNGSLKRVTVEHGIKNPEPILKLQAKLHQKLPALKLKPPEDFHVTLFNFGQPEQLYLEIKQYNRHLAFQKFLAAFLAIIREYEHIMPEPIIIPAYKIEKLGNPKEPVVALILQNHAKLVARHQQVEAAFLEFLHSQGIDNLPDFLESSYLNFQLQQPFKAHVSLGRLPDNADLPEIKVNQIEIRLTRSRLRNVKVLEHGDWVWSH